MEKVIYALWRSEGVERERFNQEWRESIAPRLAEHGRAVRLNLQDRHVAGGTSPRMNSTSPPIEAVVQLWLDSAHDDVRQPVDQIIAEGCSRFSGWLACESTPIPNRLHPPAEGHRTEGFSQVVFLGRPPRLTWEAWRHIWQESHTTVGIETQSNFEYVQNLIVRPLTYGAPEYAGMIEECFPQAALADESVYYDSAGNAEKCAENQRIMAESCARFIDFDRIDCIPTSQFEIKSI